MAGMLDRVRGLLGSPEPDLEPDAYVVSCYCGAEHRGERRAEPSVRTCRRCGATLLIFPESPLRDPGPAPIALPPEDPATAPRRPPRREFAAPLGPSLPQSVHVEEDDQEPEVAAPARRVRRPAPDEPGERPAREPIEEPRRRGVPTSVKRSLAARRSEKQAGRGTARPAERSKPSEPEPRPDGIFVPQRKRHLGRWAGLALLAVVIVLSVSWQWRSGYRQTLQERMVPEATAGVSALQEARLDAAYESLSFAIEAMDQLDAHPADEPKYRQAYAQVVLLRDLVDQPIGRILDDTGGDVAEAEARLVGHTVLLDTTVRREATGWEADFVPVMPDPRDEEAGIGVPFDVSRLGLLDRLPLDADGSRIVFGARIEAITPDPDGTHRIRLEPGSGVLLTEPALFRLLGMDQTPEEIEQRVLQQSWLAEP